MTIRDDGLYVCDICGEDVGKFNQDTGNHPACEETVDLRQRIAELESRIIPDEVLDTCITLCNEAVYDATFGLPYYTAIDALRKARGE